jgi:TetR/AcrR family transcriptional regulator
MRKPAPPKRDAQKTRQKLLDTATRAFAAEGFEGARIDEIAARAGANKRMIYVYFGSKEGLYSEVVRSHFDRVFTAGEAPDASLPPEERVRRTLRNYFYFLAENDHYVRLLSFELLGSGRRASAALADQTSAGLEHLRSALTDGVRSGVFKKDVDLRQLMLSIQVLCVGHFTHQPLAKALWKRDFAKAKVLEQTLEHLIALIFHGIYTA